jgi:hypothetical protein
VSAGRARPEAVRNSRGSNMDMGSKLQMTPNRSIRLKYWCYPCILVPAHVFTAASAPKLNSRGNRNRKRDTRRNSNSKCQIRLALAASSRQLVTNVKRRARHRCTSCLRARTLYLAASSRGERGTPPRHPVLARFLPKERQAKYGD